MVVTRTPSRKPLPSRPLSRTSSYASFGGSRGSFPSCRGASANRRARSPGSDRRRGRSRTRAPGCRTSRGSCRGPHRRRRSTRAAGCCCSTRNLNAGRSRSSDRKPEFLRVHHRARPGGVRERSHGERAAGADPELVPVARVQRCLHVVRHRAVLHEIHLPIPIHVHRDVGAMHAMAEQALVEDHVPAADAPFHDPAMQRPQNAVESNQLRVCAEDEASDFRGSARGARETESPNFLRGPVDASGNDLVSVDLKGRQALTLQTWPLLLPPSAAVS